MKRFFHESEDNFFDKDDFEEVDELHGFASFEDDEEAFTAFISKQDLMHAFENEEIRELELNQDLLITAISLAERKLFWAFYPEKKQMDIIERIYHNLLSIRHVIIIDESELKEED